MTSTRPYLIRAIFEWIIDNKLTPYLSVNANMENVEVPQQHINKDGTIVLNIMPASVKDLELDDEWISFQARFGGTSHSIYFPVHAVLAIFAKENGEGMAFKPEEIQTNKPKISKTDENPPIEKPKRPNLKLVK
jgi:stringent starvation protein B